MPTTETAITDAIPRERSLVVYQPDRPQDTGPAHISDGTTASYYELPPDAKELQDIISFKDMNAQMGEIFRATMRYGEVAHSAKMRDINKIIFYATEEKKRLEMYENG